jgi:hypothetical protein
MEIEGSPLLKLDKQAVVAHVLIVMAPIGIPLLAFGWWMRRRGSPGSGRIARRVPNNWRSRMHSKFKMIAGLGLACALGCANAGQVLNDTLAMALAGSLSGDYEYLGQGRCSVTQTGANVRMLCTWAPAGRGPHYEIRGSLAGSTITGQWYSLYAKKGWYRYVGRVRPDGSIEQSQSEDPIGANIRAAVLTRLP